VSHQRLERKFLTCSCPISGRSGSVRGWQSPVVPDNSW